MVEILLNGTSCKLLIRELIVFIDKLVDMKIVLIYIAGVCLGFGF